MIIDMDELERKTVAKWNHERLHEYVMICTETARSDRAISAWREAKARATEAVRLACREEAATRHSGSYHASLSRDATIRKATAEIARQEAVILAAQRKLKAAQTALRTAQATEISADDGRRDRATTARAEAERLGQEAERLHSVARAVAAPPRRYRRRQEILDMLRERAADPGYQKICRLDIDATGRTITVSLDARGNPDPCTFIAET